MPPINIHLCSSLLVYTPTRNKALPIQRRGFFHTHKTSTAPSSTMQHSVVASDEWHYPINAFLTTRGEGELSTNGTL